MASGSMHGQPLRVAACVLAVSLGFSLPARGEEPERAASSGGSRLVLQYRRPAREWTEALPIGNGRLGGMVTCVMALYWPDVDAAWQRAVAAGAEVIYPLEDQFYGERGGRLRDPFGQQWMMSQHIEDVPAEEMARRAAAFFSR